MTDSPRADDLPGLLDRGLDLVERRLRDSGGARIHDSIRSQLLYMKRIVDEGAIPTDTELDSLTLGVYAAREFETTDPEFADVLFTVEYLFKRL
jgi:hypothetical protein